jgi:hypothetical protein
MFYRQVFSLFAEVAKWQTQLTQNQPPARVCRFESDLRQTLFRETTPITFGGSFDFVGLLWDLRENFLPDQFLNLAYVSSVFRFVGLFLDFCGTKEPTSLLSNHPCSFGRCSGMLAGIEAL